MEHHKTMKTVLVVLAMLSAVLVLTAGCRERAVPGKSVTVPSTGEVVTDSTTELDNGLQEVDDLTSIDQEAQDDISFEELDDVDLS